MFCCPSQRCKTNKHSLYCVPIREASFRNRPVGETQMVHPSNVCVSETEGDWSTTMIILNRHAQTQTKHALPNILCVGSHRRSQDAEHTSENINVGLRKICWTCSDQPIEVIIDVYTTHLKHVHADIQGVTNDGPIGCFRATYGKHVFTVVTHRSGEYVKHRRL